MRTTLRRRLFFSLLLALALPLISCDSGGSGDSEPIWIGDWEAISVDGPDYEEDSIWSLTKDELEIRDVKTGSEESGSCDLFEFNVDNIDGNTVEYSVDEGSFVLEFEESGNQIIATVTESPDPDEEGATITLDPVSSVPDCQ